MLENIKNWLKNYNVSRENYSIIIVSLFGLWVAWNSLSVITKNNSLIEEITTKTEETAVLELENEKLALSIEYFKTDEFIEKAAKRDLLLRAPGEQVAIAPKTENAAFTPDSVLADNQQGEKANALRWFDFFLGRNN
ncbi:TPA: hypothetical protein EYO12_03470 [Candidatus Saccharibacteria bacterium]|nr:hypothetical protein [Candidatus Saccharibacteria bacterium]HIO87909.1 hypothetical protein [Candidatus Saccharibacteria bacterium]